MKIEPGLSRSAGSDAAIRLSTALLWAVPKRIKLHALTSSAVTAAAAFMGKSP